MENKPRMPKKLLIIHIAVGCFVMLTEIALAVMIVQYRKLSISADLVASQKEEMSIIMAKDQAEMQEQITLLSNELAEKIANEEAQAQLCYPKGLPVSGKATILSQPSSEGEEGKEGEEPQEGEEGEKEDPMVVFNVQHGAKVMAAGKGTVVKVESDEEFGNRVVIDHGNGYFTIYRYNDAPKVKEGDDVSIGQLLFEVNYVSSKVGYQMMYDEEYINPMDVMEING